MNGPVQGEPLQLVQGMRQLQQAYIGKSDSKDVELKGGIDLPAMPELGPESSVAFADWLYELEQAIGGLSDKASTWCAACLEVARQAYTEYTLASPLARVSLQPRVPEPLRDSKWARLERRVMTLLLGTTQKAAKEDAITHRIVDVPSLLFRLHVLYQPGGSSERAAILKHLEAEAGNENVHECIAALRKWRRYLERAEAMQVSVPDPSLLLNALEIMVRKVLAAHPQVKFRVDLNKNQLQLQGRPTLEGVLQLYTHLLAELQVVAPVSLTPATTALKAIGASAGTGEALTPTGSPTRKAGPRPPCKFFLTSSGCTRGQNCKYDHSFPSKEEKKARCWECGSQQHRKGECPTKQARASGTTARSNPESPAHAQNAAGPSPSRRQQPALEALQTSVVPSEIQLASSSSSAPAPSASTPVPTQVEAPSRPSDSDVQSLLQEANDAMLSKLAKLQTLEVKTNHSIVELSAAIKAAGLQEEEGFALLDTGASHAFKTADNEVIAQASPVRVELAGGQYVTLKQNKAGTLLAAADDPTAMNATPILPLGALVQTLGCELTWTRKSGLRVVHPEFGVLRTFVKGNHPMLAETQALEIISQLEDHHLRTLEDSAAATLVRSLDYEEVKSWDFMLGKFAATGERGCLLEALRSSCSPLGLLPQHVLSLTAVHVSLDDKQGWKYLAFP